MAFFKKKMKLDAFLVELLSQPYNIDYHIGKIDSLAALSEEDRHMAVDVLEKMVPVILYFTLMARVCQSLKLDPESYGEVFGMVFGAVTRNLEADEGKVERRLAVCSEDIEEVGTLLDDEGDETTTLFGAITLVIEKALCEVISFEDSNLPIVLTTHAINPTIMSAEVLFREYKLVL